MLARLLIIVMLVAQPLVYAADWACGCRGDAQPLAQSCCSSQTQGCCGGESEGVTLSVAHAGVCSCGCDEDASLTARTPPTGCCPSRVGGACHACPGCQCAWRPTLPNAPIAPRAARIAMEHWALPPVFELPSARAGFGFSPTAGPTRPAGSWLARCTDANARRIALCSWTT